MPKATFITFAFIVGVMKTKILSDIAEIRFGINARTHSQGDVVCLQGKDFDEFGEIDHSGLLYLSEDQCKDTDFLQPGDVLFAAKGSRNYAVMWRGEIPRAVASSTFFVIRNLDSEVLPEYLVWYLMSVTALRYFNQNVKQATVRSLSIKTLNLLPVTIKEAKEQSAIVNIFRSYQQEQLVLQRILEARKKLIFNLNIKNHGRCNSQN